MINKYLPFITGVLLYITLCPFFVWGFVSNKYILYLIYAIISAIYFSKNEISKNIRLFFYLLFVIFLYSFITEQSFLSSCILGLCLFVPFSGDEFTKKTLCVFVNVYSVIMILSVSVWILVLMGIVQPIAILEPLNSIKPTTYSLYYFVVAPNDYNFFRFCGPFDEPGVVGTFSSIILVHLRYNFSNWRTPFLVLACILSTSLFFVVITFFYFLINTIANKQSIIYIIVFSLAMGLFYYSTKDDDIVSEAVWERLEWNDKEGGMAGDNRTGDDFDKIYDKKKWTLEYFFGVKEFGKYANYYEGASSYKVVVFQAGMFFLIMYVLFFLIYARKYCNNLDFIMFLILFLGTIYQRPGIFGIPYFFLFTHYVRSIKK